MVMSGWRRAIALPSTRWAHSVLPLISGLRKDAATDDHRCLETEDQAAVHFDDNQRPAVGREDFRGSRLPRKPPPAVCIRTLRTPNTG
ncbi:hypothetical protein GPN2_13107 [Streptomyces murinus]